MTTVVHEVGVKPWTIWHLPSEEISHLRLEGGETEPTGGEITAEDIDHVMQKETLHGAEESNRATVHFLHAGCWE